MANSRQLSGYDRFLCAALFTLCGICCLQPWFLTMNYAVHFRTWLWNDKIDFTCSALAAWSLSVCVISIFNIQWDRHLVSKRVVLIYTCGMSAGALALVFPAAMHFLTVLRRDSRCSPDMLQAGQMKSYAADQWAIGPSSGYQNDMPRPLHWDTHLDLEIEIQDCQEKSGRILAKTALFHLFLAFFGVTCGYLQSSYYLVATAFPYDYVGIFSAGQGLAALVSTGIVGIATILTLNFKTEESFFVSFYASYAFAAILCFVSVFLTWKVLHRPFSSREHIHELITLSESDPKHAGTVLENGETELQSSRSMAETNLEEGCSMSRVTSGTPGGAAAEAYESRSIWQLMRATCMQAIINPFLLKAITFHVFPRIGPLSWTVSNGFPGWQTLIMTFYYAGDCFGRYLPDISQSLFEWSSGRVSSEDLQHGESRSKFVKKRLMISKVLRKAAKIIRGCCHIDHRYLIIFILARFAFYPFIFAGKHGSYGIWNRFEVLCALIFLLGTSHGLGTTWTAMYGVIGTQPHERMKLSNIRVIAVAAGCAFGLASSLVW